MTFIQRWVRPLKVRAAVAGLVVLAACTAPNPSVSEEAPPASAEPSPTAVTSAELSTDDGGLSPAPAPRMQGPVTLPAAIEIALGANPDLSMAVARVARSLAELQGAEAGNLPSFGMNLSYLRADAPSMFLFRTIDAGRFQPGTDFNDPGAFSDFNAGLTLNYNLYDGGQHQLQKSIAQQGVDVAKLEQSAAETLLVGGVIDSWYSVLEAREQVATAGQSAEMIAAQLDAARAGYEEGSRLKTDVLSLQVRHAEARELTLRAENGQQLSLAILAQWMGLGHDTQVELAPGDASWGVVPANKDEAFARAFRSRTEPALSRARLGQARSQLDLAQTAWRPRADFFASGWRDSPELDGFDDSRDNWALGLSLSWALFDGARGPGEERARAMLEEASRGQQKTWLAIELDVQQTWATLENARARRSVAGEAVASAEENLRLIQAQYENGAVPVTRYLEAELMLTQARMRNTSAGFDLQRSRAALARALGELGQANSKALEEKQ